MVRLQRFLSFVTMSVLLGSLVLGQAVSALSIEQRRVYSSGILNHDLIVSGSCDASGNTALNGADNIQKAFNYFVAAGLSEAQSAAVVGNLRAESSLNPERVEGNSKHSELPATSKDPVGLPVIDGWPGDQTRQPGWGIAQWTPSKKIVPIAEDLGITGPIYELSTQLQIILAEMKGTAPTGKKDVYNAMKAFTSNDPTEATKYFSKNFEGPLIENSSSRVTGAKATLEDYGGTSSGTMTVSGASAGCGSVGAVDCNNAGGDDTPAEGLSQVRQNVVCLTKGELALWDKGTLHPGGDPPSFYKYSENTDQEWCADFVSWIFKQAGYPLGDGSRWRVPAVDGVRSIGDKGDKFSYHDAGSYIPKPGDIVVYKVGMSHVNIVVAVNQNKSNMTVIGGNQSGTSTANSSSKVSQYDTSYTGGHGLTGFVSPRD